MSSGTAPDSLCTDVLDGLERVGMPAYLVDRDGRIQWQNGAFLSLLGDARGRLLSSLAAPDHVQRSREQLARKLLGGLSRTDFEIDVIDRNGGRTPVSVSSVPVRHGGDIVGAFGIAAPSTRADQAAPSAETQRESLTPRQHEVLRLLADGRSTEEIAASLGLSDETVRNHIRQLLRRLGVHSRLAAVAYARRHGLL